MAVNLGKSSVSTNSTSIQNQSNSVKDPVELLKNQVGFKVFDGYCDQNTFNSLIQYGVQSCGLSDKKCEVILGVEFENKNIVNEKFLLIELDSLLHQFTDSDKKLDQKEKNDAIQFLCKARLGYTHGLNYDVANRFIIDFCRKHRVKVKSGFLKWEIP